jgi:feruloyl esterase
MIAFALSAVLAATPCAGLKALSLPDTTITVAELTDAGPFTPPAQGPNAALAILLPAHCRVAATIKPTPDSNIEIEVWMPVAAAASAGGGPLSGWNGKFQAVGNGGWAGTISYAAMAAALQDGYATASTDTGHKGGDSVFALGHPERVKDFAYRAVHEMTVKSKAIIWAFYDRGPRLSYWNGCSTGGKQGLIEAQRYPDDFDGIISGAPANNWTRQHAADIVKGMDSLKDKGNFLPPAKIALLHNAVLEACDAKDGVKDGILNDPRQCTFDPATLLCKTASSDSCLTPAELVAAKAGYADTKLKSGELVFPGWPMGTEATWSTLPGVPEPLVMAQGMFKYATHQDPSWTWQTFDLEKETAASDAAVSFINAMNPDLSKFQAHGGKLLIYHGWADAVVSPGNTVNYFDSVLKKMGAGTSSFARLFMAPGMQHCNGGPGPSQMNYVGALERWREGNIAPNALLAVHVTANRVDMTRPVCAYPQVATYAGTGSTNDAANFVCK